MKLTSSLECYQCGCIVAFCCRMGAPFYNQFMSLRARLEDAGILEAWTEMVMADRAKSDRQKGKQDLNSVQHLTVKVRLV